MAYPIMLDIAARTCVVVGGGAVAARKVAALLDAGAVVTVISPALVPPLAELLAAERIHAIQTPYASGMLDDAQPLLVFAATDDAAVNAQVAADAAAVGALVNRADAPHESSFASMATLRRGAVTIGISTGGASPALAAHLRGVLEGLIGDEYATLAAWLGEARLEGVEGEQTERAALWRSVIEPVLALLRDGREAEAHALLDAMTALEGV
jgi:precorrin-2 dehydrogenase / sirohydrochlorin ferrochelatase